MLAGVLSGFAAYTGTDAIWWRIGYVVLFLASFSVIAPIINEYPLTLECRVLEIMERDNGGCFVIGEIVNTIADPSILTDGKIDLDKLQPIVFDASNLCYRSVGASVGQAWGAGKVYMNQQ